MKPKNPPATRFKYAPNLEEGELVLLSQSGYVYPAIFVKDTRYGTVHTYTLHKWSITRIEEGKKPYCNYITGSSTADRVIRTTEDVLDTEQKEVYHKLKKYITDKTIKAEEREQKKALKKISTKEGFVPGNIVVCQAIPVKNLTLGKEYFIQLVDKKARQVMLVDDSGFPTWHKTKYFVKNKEVEEPDLA